MVKEWNLQGDGGLVAAEVKRLKKGLGFGGLDGGMVSGFYIWNKIKNKKKIEKTLK